MIWKKNAYESFRDIFIINLFRLGICFSNMLYKDFFLNKTNMIAYFVTVKTHCIGIRTNTLKFNFK